MYCPCPVTGARDQRGHDGHVGEMAAHVPGHYRRRARSAARVREHRPRHSRKTPSPRPPPCVQQVAGEIVAPRAGLAERGQRAHDQAGSSVAQVLVTEPERRQKARPEGFDDDIRRCRQTAEQSGPVGGLDIERDAAFRRVVVPERQAALRVRDVVEKRAKLPAGRCRRAASILTVHRRRDRRAACRRTGRSRRRVRGSSARSAGPAGTGRSLIRASLPCTEKRGRLLGQNVPSSKPARRSAWLNPSRPSIISRVCSPISGLGRWFAAGVSDILNGAFVHLVAAHRGMFHLEVHFAMAQLRVMFDTVFSALHRQRPNPRRLAALGQLVLAERHAPGFELFVEFHLMPQPPGDGGRISSSAVAHSGAPITSTSRCHSSSEWHTMTAQSL